MITANQTIPGYYTLIEAATVIGLSQRGAEKAAIREEWKPYPAGTTYLYRAEDVHEYRDHRLRTELVKALGWRGRGLYRNDDIDIKCPVCGAFAVEWPAPPELADSFRCIDGHFGYDYAEIDPDTGDNYVKGESRNHENDQNIPW
jgi:hypothetical protein